MTDTLANLESDIPQPAQQKPKAKKKAKTEEPPVSLVTKLTQIQASIESVEKKGHNTHQNYKYVREPELFEAVRSQLSHHHIMLIPSVVGIERDGQLATLHLLYKLIDGDTGEVIEIPWIAEGKDVGDKAINKALTAGIKYVIYKLWLIPTVDEYKDLGTHPAGPVIGHLSDAENDNTESPPQVVSAPVAQKTAESTNLLVLSVETGEERTSKHGKQYRQRTITFSDGSTATTISDNIAGAAAEACKEQYAVEIDLEVPDNPRFKPNLKSIGRERVPF